MKQDVYIASQVHLIMTETFKGKQSWQTQTVPQPESQESSPISSIRYSFRVAKLYMIDQTSVLFSSCKIHTQLFDNFYFQRT